MKLKSPLIFLVTVLFLVGSFSTLALSQKNTEINKEFIKDIQSINSYFDTMDYYSVKIKHVHYANNREAKSSFQSNGYYRKSGRTIHSRLLDIETFQNSDFMLIVDSNQKKMILSKPDYTKGALQLTTQLNALISQVREVQLYHTQNSYKVYKIDVSSQINDVKYIEIELSDDTKLLRRISIYYKPVSDKFSKNKNAKTTPIIDIIYSNWMIGKQAESYRFNWSDFLKIKEGNYVPNAKYANYKFINQLNTKNN